MGSLRFAACSAKSTGSVWPASGFLTHTRSGWEKAGTVAPQATDSIFDFTRILRSPVSTVGYPPGGSASLSGAT